MARSMNLGMPRIGPAPGAQAGRRGLLGRAPPTAATLADVARTRRAATWRPRPRRASTASPRNDFSLYDQVLDTTCLVGAVPARFGPDGGAVDLDTYFALARGTTRRARGRVAPAGDDQVVRHQLPLPGPRARARHRTSPSSSTKPVDEFTEALALGIVDPARPPRSRHLSPAGQADRPRLLPPGAPPRPARRLRPGPRRPGRGRGPLGPARRALSWAPTWTTRTATAIDCRLRRPLPPDLEAPVGHLLLRPGRQPGPGHRPPRGRAPRRPGPGPGPAPRPPRPLDADTVLSAGVVDGRNVWRNDLRRTLGPLAPAQERLGDRLWVGPSCSLQHVPHDLGRRDRPPTRAGRSWLGLRPPEAGRDRRAHPGPRPRPEAVADALAASDQAVDEPASSAPSPAGRGRRRLGGRPASVAAVRPSPYEPPGRPAPGRCPCPCSPPPPSAPSPRPTEIRAARQRHASGRLTDDDYRRFCRDGDRPGHPDPGGPRPRRPRPRRTRAQRHGPVLRRTASTASPPPATAGSRATAPATSGPPSSTATSARPAP